MACRQGAERATLLRLVLSPDDQLVVDYTGRLPGRGAWVHPSQDCLVALEQRPGPLSKALGGPADTAGLPGRVRERVVRAVRDGLSMAAAAGALVGGRERLVAELGKQAVSRVVVAADASEQTVEELRRAGGPTVGFHVVPIGRDDLGEAVGKGPRAALGVRPSRASGYLVEQLDRLRALG